MIPSKSTIVELHKGELEEMLRRVEARQLQADDYETIRELIESYVGLTLAVGDKSTTIRRLRQMLFGATTEKTAAVVGAPLARDENEAVSPASSGVEAVRDTRRGRRCKVPRLEPIVGADVQSTSQMPAPGHGRNAADDYVGAEKIKVPHPSLSPGDPCPQCETGTVYETGRPGVVVRLIGQSPVGAKVTTHLQKLRLQSVRRGLHRHTRRGRRVQRPRLEPIVGADVQSTPQMPAPGHGRNGADDCDGRPRRSTCRTRRFRPVIPARKCEPVFAELVQQAAQGDVVYNDDTTIKIIEVMWSTASGPWPKSSVAPRWKIAPKRLRTTSPHRPARTAVAGRWRLRCKKVHGRAHGHVHLGHRVDAGRATDRVVLQWTPACRGEPPRTC